jgi:acetylglutamate kinase
VKKMTDANQYKLDLLREAIPYIRKFKGKTFVIKFSGKVTEDRANLLSLSEELALLHQVGIKLCVIHGGGKQLTELAEKLGIAQTVIQGRRVTDDDTLELAKMIFAGKINTEILAALRNRGVEAVGLSGIDGGVVHAERRPPKEVTDKETGLTELVDYGHVGDVLEVNTKLVTQLLDGGYLPVISSLAADEEGRVFNINADTIATEIALRLKAEKLILMSDVKGIYLDPQNEETKLSRVTPAFANELIETGRATAGMIPKLQSLIRLVTGGVKSAHIISGTQRNALLSEVFTDQGAGTMFTDDQKESTDA